MRIRIFLLAVAMLGGTAAAVPVLANPFPVVVKAYESNLPSLRLPGNSSGTLTFKACADCDFQTVRVTPGTRYEANGQVYDLEHFRKLVANLDERSNAAVTIKHHLESNTITAVKVTTF